jgi:hypothetical protein
MSPASRVAAAYVRALSVKTVRENALPINKSKGIDKAVVRNNVVTDSDREDSVKPLRGDIQPKDVFPATPNNTAVLSLAQSGRDLARALEKQVPRDKGYDVVRNLSQYLIRTEGNGSPGTAEG